MSKWENFILFLRNMPPYVKQYGWAYCGILGSIHTCAISTQFSFMSSRAITCPQWVNPYCVGIKLSRFNKVNVMAADALGPIPEMIRSWLAQIRSCDPDRLIAFHKRRSRSAHQIEKIRNQTVYCQLNHDINHSLGNLELKLRGHDWMKNVRLMISIHDVTMGGVAMSFRSADTRASWPVQCMHTVFAHDTTCFGHAIFDRYVYVNNVIENIYIVDTRQTMFQ